MDVRKRLTGTLFGGAALGATGNIAAVTVATLAVQEITGRATLAGLPGAVAIVGTAVGTSLLTTNLRRWGRRPGLVLGYVLGVVGALLAVTAVVTDSLALLLVGMATLGLGHASNQLARYTAAEMYPPEHRASALSLIVWAGTVGAVLGPTLLKPFGALATDRGVSELAGGYIVAFLFMLTPLVLYLVALRPDPFQLVQAADLPGEDRKAAKGTFARPHVRVALAAMISGQVVMVLIMTATPLHIRHAGADLGIIGIVMSSHTLGMFAFSPLTGRLTDRIGHYPTIIAGLVVLAISAILALAAPASSTVGLLIALFLLGLGWNLGFVAGSAMLTLGFSPAVRAHLQGRADSITWASSAVASLAAGIFYEMADYRIVALGGLALLAVPVIVVTRNRSVARLVLT